MHSAFAAASAAARPRKGLDMASLRPGVLVMSDIARGLAEFG